MINVRKTAEVLHFLSFLKHTFAGNLVVIQEKVFHLLLQYKQK